MKVADIAERLECSEQDALELVELLIDSGTADLARLTTALDQGHAETAAAAAHSLKGASASLGFDDVSNLAKQVETQIHHQNFLGAAELVRGLVDHMAAIQKVVGPDRGC
jgi:HPt (histidine-containing phosphotransfer) domain-containing protein